MKLGRLARVAAACATLSATAGIMALTQGTASASYGPGTMYQVEISANVNNLGTAGGQTNGSGGGFWFWAALTPSAPGATTGTVDYQESDCVHNFAVPNGDSHNSGTTTYTDSQGWLTIYSVGTGLGAQDITIPDTYGHYGAGQVNLGTLLTLFLTNIQAQVAP